MHAPLPYCSCLSQTGRDATTWGVTFLGLQDQGIRFQDLACDGARGIQSGMEQAELPVPLRPDLFHLLRESNVLARRLEGKAYKARRAEMESQLPKRRIGRPLKVQRSLAEAESHQQQAISCYDCFIRRFVKYWNHGHPHICLLLLSKQKRRWRQLYPC